MTDDEKLMQQALDAMMTIRPYEVVDYDQLEASITALRERMAQPSKPLTDEQIQAAVTNAVRERKLSWLGFRKDDQGEYTIPVLSPSDYQMARAIEAAHGIKE